jgi:hypothetical protein
MMRRFDIAIGMIGMLALAFASMAGSAPGRPFSARLLGSEETRGGDPDGRGTVTLTLDPRPGRICYKLTVTGIATPTAAHIHLGRRGETGTAVVTLQPPTEGSRSDCVDADPDLVRRIAQNPGDYYINVHTADHPDGALRGQLRRR